MRRIVSISSARGTLDAPALSAIALSGMENNERDGLTGILFYSDGSFLSAIEGPDDALTATIRRMRLDQRHTGYIAVSDEKVTDRIFPDWSLACFTPRASSETSFFMEIPTYDDLKRRLRTTLPRDVEVFVRTFFATARADKSKGYAHRMTG